MSTTFLHSAAVALLVGAAAAVASYQPSPPTTMVYMASTGSNAYGGGDTRYLPVSGSADAAGATTVSANHLQVMPRGTITALYCTHSNGVSPGTATFTLMKNTVAQALTCQMSGVTPPTHAWCGDTASGHAVSVSRGDKLNTRVVFASSANAGTLSCEIEFVPAA